MTAILGISAFYHDSAAALVVDGEIVAAAQEERFTRKKHDHDVSHARDRVLPARGGPVARASSTTSASTTSRCSSSSGCWRPTWPSRPRGFRSFLQAMPLWLKQKLHLPREICDAAWTASIKKRFVFTEHHESHAASAFFPSPFEEAAILTLDGVGEWATASFGVGRGNRIELTHELRFPHSLGLLYSAFTYYTGFKVNSGEYKLMGLAPYGEPRYADLIREQADRPEGRRLVPPGHDVLQLLPGADDDLARSSTRLFGGPPRKPESPLTQREMDLAASIQAVTEEIMLRMARHVHAQTGHEEPLPGRRRRAQLRRQRPDSARRAVRRTSGSSPRRATPAGRSASRCSSGISCSTSRARPQHRDSQQGSLLGPRSRTTRFASCLDGRGATIHAASTTTKRCASASPS